MSDLETLLPDSDDERELSAEQHAFEFKLQNPKPVYQELLHHQVTETDWDLQSVLEWLAPWKDRFIEAFSLDIEKISLCVNWLPVSRYGHFRRGHNGFGLEGEVAINRRYLHARKPWEILGTLLHELLHAWQEIHGKPGKRNYHNKQFREKARSLGLIIDQRGHTQYEKDSPFFDLLNQHGVETPDVPPVMYVVRGQSKLKKWSCQCHPPINVRVAVAHFYARCLWCGEEFQQAESPENLSRDNQ